MLSVETINEHMEKYLHILDSWRIIILNFLKLLAALYKIISWMKVLAIF